VIEALLALAKLVVRRAEGVDLVGEAGGERGEAGLDGSAQDERRVGLLQGSRQRSLPAKLVARPAMVEGVLGPRPDHDLDLLGEELEPLFRVQKRESVLDVLTLVPAGSHTHVDAPSRDVIDGDGHPGEHARMPERRR